MTLAFKIVIPARYESSRLPGKPLADIHGKPMIQRVYEAAVAAGSDDVVIATDNSLIAMAAAEFGAAVCMTAKEHMSGTDRLCEVVEKFGWADDTIVVNLQGDEPLIPASIIRQVAENLEHNQDAGCATLYTGLGREDAADPNIVKLVTDSNDFALYFSRSVIPYIRDPADPAVAELRYKRHIGMYAYRAGLLRQYRTMEPVEVEFAEKLEQLRLLWHGVRIHAAQAVSVPGHGVDTPEDLDRVRAAIPPDP